MSGSAGGNRINREDVEKTFFHYQKNVLEHYNNYKNSVITGSYNTSEKKDFGDIDIIVELDTSDKRSAKKDFSQFLITLPSNLIVPFRSIKYKGKYFLNTGEIVTILYPIIENKGYVQIDNIISTSLEETIFKKEFLDLPAIKQGLMMGLVKTIILEDCNVLKNFSKLPIITHNQEFEFNLSSSGLTLRLVTLTSNYKTINKEEVWKTTNWKVIENLLKEYNFNESFESIVNKIKNTLHNSRSINRVKGIFKSMVSVKSGEKDTSKGFEKDQALNIISKI